MQARILIMTECFFRKAYKKEYNVFKDIVKAGAFALCCTVLLFIAGCGRIDIVNAKENPIVFEAFTPTGSPSVTPGATPTATPAPTATSMPVDVPIIVRSVSPVRTPEPVAEPVEAEVSGKWVGTWANATFMIGIDAEPPYPGLSGNTYRQVIRGSIGGNKIRVTFSNMFGEADLEIKGVHVARALNGTTSEIRPETDTVLTFGESESVTVHVGETVTCDPLDFELPPLGFLAVTTEFGKTPEIITGHSGARGDNYLLAGSHLGDTTFVKPARKTSWYFLSDVDVLAEGKCRSVVCFGDSITDGYGVTKGSYSRWSDVLAERLQSFDETGDVGVLNSGIGGNAIYGGKGDPALVRFKRDVLENDGVEYVIILIGVNDIGMTRDASIASIANKVIKGLSFMITAAQEKGIKACGCTITPFRNHSYYNATREKIRQEVNAWIRSEEAGFDTVIDFDLLLRDETKNDTLKAELGTDYLHPNNAGYRKMGEFIDLNLFVK